MSQSRELGLRELRQPVQSHTASERQCQDPHIYFRYPGHHKITSSTKSCLMSQPNKVPLPQSHLISSMLPNFHRTKPSRSPLQPVSNRNAVPRGGLVRAGTRPGCFLSTSGPCGQRTARRPEEEGKRKGRGRGQTNRPRSSWPQSHAAAAEADGAPSQ